MEVSRLSSGGVVAVCILLFALVLPAIHAQVSVPAPSPTSDGTSIDQGVAYVLMFVALALTYLIHSFETPFVL